MRDKVGKFVKGHKCLFGSEKGWIRKGQHLSPKTEFKKGENLGKQHRNWKGGRYKKENGYIWVYAPNHPKAYRNGMYEHILVLEKKIGRYLEGKECCHHLNGIKDDNRPENLMLFESNGKHRQKYEIIDKRPLPQPNIMGRIISLRNKKGVDQYIIKRCVKCNQLFWTRKNGNFKKHRWCKNV